MAKKSKKQIERGEQIYQITSLVAGNFSISEVLDKLAEIAVEIVGVKACSIRLLDEEAAELKMRSTYGLSEAYRNKGPVTRDDPVIQAAFAGEAVVIDDMRLDDRIKYKEATIREGLVSQLTVAMKFRDKVIGVLRLYSPSPKKFDDDDLLIVRSLAGQCATAIRNAQLYAEAIAGARMAEQMRLAGIIQRRMIPEHAPNVPGLEIAATYIPCFEVGGDVYGFYPVGKQGLIVNIADVIGKGVPAALMTSWFRGIIQAYVERMKTLMGCPTHADSTVISDAMKNIVTKMNQIACRECQDGEFITMFHSFIDVGKMQLTYCNCGHEPTMLIRDGEIFELNKGGLVLGVLDDYAYEIDTIELQPGDCLLYYTDGLEDAANFESEFWGIGRLQQTIRQICHQTCTPQQLIDQILALRRRFVGLARQTDDTSVVAVKVKGTDPDG